MPLLLADVVDMVPGLTERLIPPERLLCLTMASRRFRDVVGDMLNLDCGRELFWRLKPSVSAKDAKRIKLWRFKKCQIHLRVPASSMMEPLHVAFKNAFKHGWQGPVDLRLAYSWCGPPGARLLADVLPQCHVLRSLDVEKCILGFEGSAVLAPALAKCTTLETLGTAECHLRSDGVQRLAMRLQSCHALTSLDMSKNQMGPSGIDFLASCLQKCPNLAHLKLSSNELGQEGCTYLARHLQLPYYSLLTSLDLSNNDVGDHGAVLVGLALEEIVSARSGLVQLNLAYNQLTSAVSAVMHTSSRYSVMRLSHNDVLPHFATEMCEGLQKSVGLRELTLSACNIQGHLPQSGSVLRALGACPNLEVLDLAANHELSDEGAEAVATGLQGSRELKILCLEYCGITDKGALALAAAMAGWVNLEHLLLKNNGIGDASAVAMASLLRPCAARRERGLHSLKAELLKLGERALDHQLQQLRILDLEANHVEDAGAEAFASALAKAKTRVRLVNLSRNFVSCKCVQRLQDRFAEAEYGELVQDNQEHLQERAEQAKEQHEGNDSARARVSESESDLKGCSCKQEKVFCKNNGFASTAKTPPGNAYAPCQRARPWSASPWEAAPPRIPFPGAEHTRRRKPPPGCHDTPAAAGARSTEESPAAAGPVTHARRREWAGDLDLDTGTYAEAVPEAPGLPELLIPEAHMRMTLIDLKRQRGRGRSAPHVLLRII